MNKQSEINPYETPATSPGPATQQEHLTLEQKADAIKSAKRRLKANESKTAIYADYKNTNIGNTIRSVLYNTPPGPRKKLNTWANLLLLFSFVGFCIFAIPFRLSSGSFGFPLLLLWGFQLFTAYQIATFYRPGYWSVNVWFLLFLVLRFPAYLQRAQETGNNGPLLASIAFGIISAGLSTILLFRLFPNYRPFSRHKVTPEGEPMFDG